ncbi:unnamed protein product [Lactuca saligna]|uniref:Uncharacterized protein n=1 Tax=Lactuca saligna TaxID=75948 RepID=A0AA36E1B4_LACSI|nr:unnamed protein product [Lactuca saligna]
MFPDQILSLQLHPDPTDGCIPLLPPEGFAASHRVSVAPPATITTSARHSLRRTSPPVKNHHINATVAAYLRRCQLSPTTSTVSDELLHWLHCFQLYNHSCVQFLCICDVDVNVFLQNPTFVTVIEDIMRSFSKQVDNATNNNDENDDGKDD